LSAPLTARMLDLAALSPGMRVLDLATGRGEPAIAAAHRVGPSGQVLGIDISASMIAMAGQRAASEGLTNLELRVMDAAALPTVPSCSFDSTLVRWGLMYMDSPVAALSEAHRALVPGGKLVAAVWAEPERVSYFSLPRRVLEKYRPLPPIDQTAPGTFRYASIEDLVGDLDRAGFRLEHLEEMELSVMEAHTPAELITWARAFGMTRLLNELPEGVQREWEEDFAREAEAFREGLFFRLGGVTRIAVASRKG